MHRSRLPDSTFREDDVLFHPDPVAPLLVQVAGRHWHVLVQYPFIRKVALGLWRVSQATRMLSLVSFSRKRFSSDSHIARQTPLIT